MFNKEIRQYKEYLLSKDWDSIREQIYKRDNYECTQCHSKINLQAHHTTYDNLYNENEHLNELTTLCKKCHHRLHKIKRDKSYYSYLVNKNREKLEQDTLNIFSFIKNNQELFIKYKNKFKKRFYMPTDEFEYEINKIFNNQFDIDMIVVCLLCKLQLQEIIDYDDLMVEKYALPRICHKIIIDRQYLDKNDFKYFKWANHMIYKIPYRDQKVFN